MELRGIFEVGALWCTPGVGLLFVIWIGLRAWISLRRYLSKLSGGASSPAGGTAGNGRSRIGPRD